MCPGRLTPVIQYSNNKTFVLILLILWKHINLMTNVHAKSATEWAQTVQIILKEKYSVQFS